MRRAKHIDRLSAAAVRTLTEPGWHSDGGGLYLEIDSSGRKRWVMRLTVNGRRRDLGLGPLHKVSLQAAREIAVEYRAKAYRGIDPTEGKRHARTRMPVPTYKAPPDWRCPQPKEMRMTKSGTARKPSDRGILNGPVSKVFDVLGLVTEAPAHFATVAEIAEALSMPRPTANRIVSNMIKLGLLQRDLGTGRLIEGRRLMSLALSTLRGASPRGARHEILARLASETRETCNVGMLTGGRVTYLDRVEASWPVTLQLEVGSQVPIYCSAIGKLLMAQMPQPQRDRLIGTLPLSRLTPHTICDPAALRRELDEIARTGVACDNEECFDNVIGIAVAIEVGPAAPVLGLSIAALSSRVSMDDLRNHLPLMRRAARRLAECYAA